MAELEDKLNSILSDPKMMQQLMSMAQSLSGSDEASEPMPNFDPGMLKKISSIANHSSIDRNQQMLLKALHPYLSQQRIRKLERAMRAAQMAKVATGVLQFQSSR
ncbi:MAG: hypothetical protein E7466_00080 [Ruminococcaceae bacterium]|nr:hypothetical protein [Oscillospiraceae bacterium]MBQ3214851.1 hypothetical protein [Oscillospiraceae bacterium]